MAVPDSAFAYPTLVRLFQANESWQVRQGIGCAVSMAAREENASEMLAMIRDRDLGDARGLLMGFFERGDRERLKRILLDSVDDPGLGSEARHQLRKLFKIKP